MAPHSAERRDKSGVRVASADSGPLPPRSKCVLELLLLRLRGSLACEPDDGTPDPKGNAQRTMRNHAHTRLRTYTQNKNTQNRTLTRTHTHDYAHPHRTRTQPWGAKTRGAELSSRREAVWSRA